ncbi:ecdysteroid-regulated 16 kDa protein-like [Arctopsyche grandis]|uniref:ecdysteroid-regulated 16 kDa protein-like n=1 Tax=Arctopsyche grandis TaxID=121162 RepID=UPI00406D7770
MHKLNDRAMLLANHVRNIVMELQNIQKGDKSKLDIDPFVTSALTQQDFSEIFPRFSLSRQQAINVLTPNSTSRMNSTSSCLLLLLVACISFATASVWSDCGSKLAKIDAVKISGCDDSAKECVLKRNTNVSIHVEFTTNTAVSKLNTVVHGVMMGMPVPFPLAHPNACEDTGLACPLKGNEKYSYTAIMPVLKSYPKVNVDVKWELQNPKTEDLICLLIPAKIQ